MIGATNASSVGGFSGIKSLGSGFRPPKAMEAKLDAELKASGLDSETISSLKSDLQASLESAFGNGSISGPQDVQKTVKGVFEKYGLDAEAMASKFGPPPFGGAGGGFGLGGIGQNFDASTDRLLKMLQDGLDKKQGGNAYQYSQFVVDSLVGVDELV